MDDAITVSSGSEKYDSDVEIVGAYTESEVDSKPFVRRDTTVDVVAVNVTPLFIDLTDPRWTFPGLRRLKRRNPNAQMEVLDLIDSNSTDGTEQKTNTLSTDTKNGNEDTNLTSNSRGSDSLHNSSREMTIVSPVQNCYIPKQGMVLASVTGTPHQRNTNKANYFPCFVNTPFVKLRRLHLAEAHVNDLKTSGYSACVTKDCKQLSLWPKQSDNICGSRECIKARTATTSNGPQLNHSADESPEVVETPWEQGQVEDKKEQGPSRKAGTKQLELNPPESRQSPVSNLSSPYLFTTELDPHIPHDFDLNSQPHTSSASPCHSLKSQAEPTLTSKDALAGKTPVWQTGEAKADLAINSPGFLCHSITSDSPSSVPRTEDLDEASVTGRTTYSDDLGVDSPVHVDWQEGSDGEEANEENKFDGNFRSTSREDRRFVCPITLRKIMSRPAQSLNAEEKDDDGFSNAEVLCRQSLSLVYSTIEESYPEGTLQLLSDLLQPGFYPPRDITCHLLRDILLDLQCPQHLCVQAFNLLMRTQRHHMADKTTLPWDWELLTSVMANQVLLKDHAKRHRCEVVRMFLEYVVQTLEDDFQTKLSLSALHRSIAKATLSCDLQFTKVRDVIKWLFTAIMKSTENGDSREAAKERDEHIRMVSVFQRMLSVALDVDRSPAVSSAKLSLELFHMLMNIVTLRAHRMLLLESLQSKLLRCKLLEHLLDYACPQKTPVPMSLSLLLHFLKNCTLTPDSMDGTERWQRWEELVHLLWMLLLSYNEVMKGSLCISVTEGTGSVRALVHKPHDVVSRPAVQEAVESFLSRSQADLGQALPLHVEESLTYLQDHLLDVCQC